MSLLRELNRIGVLRTLDDALANTLRRLDPSTPVVSEESAAEGYEARQSWRRFWLVDPLDGTKEFIKRRAEFTVNGSVWFEFNVANQTGGEVPYNALGVMPKKDGVDRREWYQQSYGGPDSTIKPGGLAWEDRIRRIVAGLEHDAGTRESGRDA